MRLRPILMTTLAMIFGMVPLAFALSEGSEQRAPMGQAVIGGVITSSLLTLVVVPVVYCYLDDLARWAEAPLARRGPRHAAVAARRRNRLPARFTTPAMNIEQARFNMIEQQIRPWDVLDQGVLSLLVGGQARGLRARRRTARWPSSTPRCRCRTASRMLAPKVEARLLQELAVQRHERVLEIGAGSGYMAALLAHKAQHVTTLEIDPELARFASDNLRRAWVMNVDACVTPTASDGLPDDGPFDVIVLSGSVAEVPRALLGAAQARRPAGGDRRPAAGHARGAGHRAAGPRRRAVRRLRTASSCSTPSRRA